VNPASSLAGIVTDAAGRAAQLDGRFLLGALALQLLNLAVRSLAWRNVLAAAYPERRIPIFSIGCSYAAGVALNAFLPARGGEAAKVALARTQLPGSAMPTIAGALSAVLVLDAVLGFTLVGTLFAFGVIPSLPGAGLLDTAPIVVGVVLGVLVLGAIGLRMRPVAVRSLAGRLAKGFAVFRTPGRYVRTVVPFQLAGWCCRIGVVFLVLGAFGIDAGLETAALLVVLNGVSTAVPVPGGVGTQQVLATYALQGIVTAAGAVSFSLGMQVGVTVVNTTVGLAATMILFRTIRPLRAIRAARTAMSNGR
jgi:uncharacterized membrane protein YbhN (UPF0104 family)